MRRSLRDFLPGLLIGASLTLGSVATYFLGGWGRLDRYGLDLHFRYFSQAQPDPRIVLVDIDDHALRSAPQWPWPRKVHADLVRTLKELHAKAIVLDLVFDRPTEPRFEGFKTFEDDNAASDDVLRGFRPETKRIDDDAELRDAIAKAGNVYLAMYAELARGESPDAADSDLIRITEKLVDDFGLDEAQIAIEQGRSSADKEPERSPHFAQAKRTAASRRAEGFLRANPAGSWTDFLATVLPEQATAARSADYATLEDAFRSERALHSVLQRGIENGDAPVGTNAVVPLDSLVQAAKGVGVVSFERSYGGGVLRSVPPLIRYRDVRLPQLGVLVASDVKGVRPDEARRTPIGEENMVKDVPVDRNGEVLIAWIRPPVRDDWRSVFEHVSATPFLEIALNRSAIEENRYLLRSETVRLVQARHSETPVEYQTYARLINRRIELELRAQAGIPDGDRNAWDAEFQRVEQSIVGFEEDSLVWLRRFWELWSAVTPESEEEQGQLETVRRLYERFVEKPLVDEIRQANEKLAARTIRLTNNLRSRIDGRLCLVGYTASAQGDLVTTPTFTGMPGVMAHAHVISMLLQDRVPRRAGPVWDGFLLLGLGLLVTMIACVSGAFGSLLGSGIVACVAFLLGAWLFTEQMVYVATMVGGVQSAIVWAGVTAYRQVTEERTRRRLQRALSQYTSPAIAAHLAGRIRTRDLAPRSAVVTCFFSDLRGFTRLSERLGPARTRERLNPYLGAVSRTLIDERAIVNKFIGDGVMAFFNAPILPWADHAGAGCRAALAVCNAVARLNEGGGLTLPEDGLHVRIGLASGEVFVGDYGTDTKLDYTCIGDTVNVASRLERVNKLTGTQILVDANTRRAAGETFLFRSIGRLQVSGRLMPVESYELLGSASADSEPQHRYAAAFDPVVRFFEAGSLDECLSALRACREMRPSDPLLNVYERLIHSFRNRPASNTESRILPLSEFTGI